MRFEKSTLIIAGLIAAIFLSLIIFLPGKREPGNDSTVNANSTSITIAVTPTNDTNITVNGKGVEEGFLKLDPGEYSIEVSRKGFETIGRQVSLKDGESAYVGVILQSNDPSTADWYTKHPEDAQKGEGISGKLSQGSADAKVRTLPLTKRLPYTVRGQYSIGYGQSKKSPDDPSAVALFVQYDDAAGKQAALNWIRYQGYDPNELEIVFTQQDTNH